MQDRPQPEGAEDHRPRIVIVEDNRADSFLLCKELAQHSKAGKIELLEDGAVAIAFFRSATASPMVIVLDMGLPKYGGLAVLRAIKHESAFADAPVIALTGIRTPREEAAALALGVTLFREKPSNLDGFRALALEITDVYYQGTGGAVSAKHPGDRSGSDCGHST